MRNRHKIPSRVPEPGAVLLALCDGPRSARDLAKHFGCRPSCIAGILHSLQRRKLICPAAKKRPSCKPGDAQKVDLAMDPAAAFALLRARIEEKPQRGETPLRGSPEYLRREAIRFAPASRKGRA